MTQNEKTSQNLSELTVRIPAETVAVFTQTIKTYYSSVSVVELKTRKQKIRTLQLLNASDEAIEHAQQLQEKLNLPYNKNR